MIRSNDLGFWELLSKVRQLGGIDMVRCGVIFLAVRAVNRATNIPKIVRRVRAVCGQPIQANGAENLLTSHAKKTGLESGFGIAYFFQTSIILCVGNLLPMTVVRGGCPDMQSIEQARIRLVL